MTANDELSKLRVWGEERFCADQIPHSIENATVLQFWQWAFGDLRQNNTRGIFAEWLVMRLLEIEQPVRDSWGDADLILPDGTTIEVKCAAYVQAWKSARPVASESAIVFSGLRGRTWSIEAGFSTEQIYKADIYVFCLHIEVDRSVWTALNLDQWRFLVLQRARLQHLGQRSLSLKRLRALAPELTARDLKGAITEASIASRCTQIENDSASP